MVSSLIAAALSAPLVTEIVIQVSVQRFYIAISSLGCSTRLSISAFMAAVLLHPRGTVIQDSVQEFHTGVSSSCNGRSSLSPEEGVGKIALLILCHKLRDILVVRMLLYEIMREQKT
jgi:hypothetical protein